jgi:hypothetical protein
LSVVDQTSLSYNELKGCAVLGNVSHENDFILVVLSIHPGLVMVVACYHQLELQPFWCLDQSVVWGGLQCQMRVLMEELLNWKAKDGLGREYSLTVGVMSWDCTTNIVGNFTCGILFIY